MPLNILVIIDAILKVKLMKKYAKETHSIFFCWMFVVRFVLKKTTFNLFINSYVAILKIPTIFCLH